MLLIGAITHSLMRDERACEIKGMAATSRAMSAMMGEGGRLFWDTGKAFADALNGRRKEFFQFYLQSSSRLGRILALHLSFFPHDLFTCQIKEDFDLIWTFLMGTDGD